MGIFSFLEHYLDTMEIFENYSCDIPDYLKNNKEFVLAAVKREVEALKYASEELKDDKEVLIEAGKTTD